jgi:lipid-A-disaccharide synthase
MIVAGEASGEIHGAELMRALRRLYPEVEFEFFGVGGQQMRAAGAEILADAKEFGVIGPVEIGRAIGRIYTTFRRVHQAARARRPDAVILIDWPDFNLQMVKKAKAAGLKTIYYISPQIWAWRRYRLRTIRRCVDKMIVILPFEVDFYRQAGVDVEFVGHPLLDVVRATKDRQSFCADYHLDPGRPIISLLPGSRRSEVDHILPVMIETAERVSQLNAQFVVPLASTISWAKAKIIIRQASDRLASSIKLIEHDTYNAVAHSELAVVASGTATLETALLETPLIIVYRGSELNFRLIRPLIQLDTFGMVNLIAGEKIAPELIQHDMNPERLAATIMDFMSHEEKRAAMKEKLKQIRQRLGPGCAAERAAQSVMQAIGHADVPPPPR